MNEAYDRRQCIRIVNYAVIFTTVLMCVLVVCLFYNIILTMYSDVVSTDHVTRD